MMDFGFYNMDCMDGMKQFPDKFFDIAVVDPPYFSGPEKRAYYGRSISSTSIKRVNYEPLDQSWHVPDDLYFQELIRVSKNQIIWGCNYYDVVLGPGRIVWDKCNGGSTYSDCEIAYCSMHDSVRIFRYMWNGMMQGKSIDEGWIMQGNKKLNEKRIHPTQKPVALYEWIVQRYFQPGWKVLDTHVGSGSSLVAYHKHGFKYVGFELDKRYFKATTERLEDYQSQMSIFDMGVDRNENWTD